MAHFENGALILESQKVRIGGNGCGYRDIVVHEMTDGEIRVLKETRVIGVVLAFVAGTFAGAGFVLWQWAQVI